MDYYKNSRACYTLEQGKVFGQKPPLNLNEIWAIRIRHQMAARLTQ